MKGEGGREIAVLVIKPWAIDGVTACRATVRTGARVSVRGRGGGRERGGGVGWGGVGRT